MKGVLRSIHATRRGVTDMASAAMFLVVFVFGAWQILSTIPPGAPSPTAQATFSPSSIPQPLANGRVTVVIEENEMTDADGQRSSSTTRTTTVAPAEPEQQPPDVSALGRIFGNDGALRLFWLAVALLAAFLAAAAVQRVALGRYGLKIGPLEIGEIDPDKAKSAIVQATADPALRGREELAPQQAPTKAWELFAESGDGRMALVAYRVEVEDKLRALAAGHGLPDRQSAGQLLRDLYRAEVIGPDAVAGLFKLISQANRAVHGADVNEGISEVLLDDGARLLSQVESLVADAPGVDRRLESADSPGSDRLLESAEASGEATETQE